MIIHHVELKFSQISVVIANSSHFTRERLFFCETDNVYLLYLAAADVRINKNIGIYVETSSILGYKPHELTVGRQKSVAQVTQHNDNHFVYCETP